MTKQVQSTLKNLLCVLDENGRYWETFRILPRKRDGMGQDIPILAKGTPWKEGCLIRGGSEMLKTVISHSATYIELRYFYSMKRHCSTLVTQTVQRGCNKSDITFYRYYAVKRENYCIFGCLKNFIHYFITVRTAAMCIFRRHCT